MKMFVAGAWAGCVGMVAVTMGLLYSWVPAVGVGSVGCGFGTFLVIVSAPRIIRGVEPVCLVFKLPRGRVHHLHRPKASIVRCTATRNWLGK